MKNNKNQKSKFLFYIFIIIGLTIVPALSVPIPGLYAIQMDSDSIVRSAIRTLSENVPQITFIESKSLKFSTWTHRFIEPVVWIGHGDKEGIKNFDSKTSWKDFAQDTKRTSSIDIVLACNSDELIRRALLTKQDVVTFGEEIDATLGALLVSYAFTQSVMVLDQAVSHYSRLFQNKILAQPLIVPGPIVLDPGDGGGSGDPTNPNLSFSEALTSEEYIFLKMSGIELTYWLLMLLVLAIDLILAVVITPGTFNFITKAAIEFWVSGKLVILISLGFYAAGGMTNQGLAESIFASLGSIGESIAMAFAQASAGEIALFLGLVLLAIGIGVLEILLDTVSAGAVTAIRVAIAFSLVVLYITGYLIDATDQSGLVG